MGPVLCSQEELLLNAEPWVVLFDLLENLLSQKTEVESSRSHFVPDEGLAQD